MQKFTALALCATFALHANIKEIATEYFELAQEYDRKKNVAQAREYYAAALAADPDHLDALFSLGNSYALAQEYATAIPYYKKIVATRPRITSALYNIAYCLKNIGATNDSITYYKRVLENQPDHSDAHQGLAQALLKLGLMSQSIWQDFEHRWSKPRSDSKKFHEYAQQHPDLTGKKILVMSEFGLGDTLQFIRYAQELKARGAFVIAQVQQALVPLLTQCPYIDQIIAVDTPKPAHDFATVLMSLPWTCDTTIKTIPAQMPYLYANPHLVMLYKYKLKADTNFKIGICWNGNLYNNNTLKNLVAAKSIPLALFDAIAALPNVSLYSLQQVSGLEQLPTVNFTVHTFDDFDITHGRFMDTAALMKNLDLVITIDTSIAHLAGGLGVPTWLLLPEVADWRWFLNRDDSPWYPTMHLFRQKHQGQWEDVVDRIYARLKQQLILDAPFNLNDQPIDQLRISDLYKK